MLSHSDSSKRRKKILFVESDLLEAWRFQGVFKKYARDEFQIIHESSLVGALRRLSREGIDLVLLDTNLPEGRGLANLVRVLLSHPKIPVVVLTDVKDETISLQALRCGAEDYVVKDDIAGREALIRISRYSIERHQYYIKGRY
jgi:DNA-binding NarL/FixJ family response regulator